jgi:hypothetical protein
MFARRFEYVSITYPGSPPWNPSVLQQGRSPATYAATSKVRQQRTRAQAVGRSARRGFWRRPRLPGRTRSLNFATASARPDVSNRQTPHCSDGRLALSTLDAVRAKRRVIPARESRLQVNHLRTHKNARSGQHQNTRPPGGTPRPQHRRLRSVELAESQREVVTGFWILR